jgi:ribonuclease P protein component
MERRKYKLYPLKKNHLFSRAYRKGKGFSSSTMVLYVLKNREKDRSLLGLTVSKKRGKAVVRNRIKRLMREAFRFYLPILKNGYLIVIVAKQPASTAELTVIREEMGELLGKATLLEDSK